MAEAPFDERRAHRWFAVELNNLAWGLVESAARTPRDDERMIHAAHASCHHWLQVGTPLNHLRAQCLLATVYAAAGLAEAALRHARRCLELSDEAGDSQTLFDRATAYGCGARAHQCAGEREKAAELQGVAREAARGFTDADEREVFERLFSIG